MLIASNRTTNCKPIAHGPFEPAVKTSVTAGSAYGRTAKVTPIITAGSYDEMAGEALLTASSIGDYCLAFLGPALMKYFRRRYKTELYSRWGTPSSPGSPPRSKHSGLKGSFSLGSGTGTKEDL